MQLQDELANPMVCTGWLLDLYPDLHNGVVFWLLDEDGICHCLHHAFPVTFYAAGPSTRLRELWSFLNRQPRPVKLERTERQDLFAGSLTVMKIQVLNAAAQPRLFQNVIQRFPELDYYDADIPLSLRYAAAYGIFPLGRCQVRVDADDCIEEISSQDSPWELDPAPPPLRILTIEPDADPFHTSPQHLTLRFKRATYQLTLEPARALLINLNAILERHDPDLIVTNWGDTWLFPHLLALAKENNISFNPNRDQSRAVLQRKENTYFAYGQVIYRGRQTHLFGRWHIDQLNAMMYGEYGLEGVFEQARVTGLPVQEIARKSPGSGITAMQMQTALRRGALVPYQKQQAEHSKSILDLLRADQGGLVYQPIIGLHRDVAEIDFISMYPSIMAHFNISPETVGAHSQNSQPVPQLGIPVDQEHTGLVPETLQPLLDKRIALKGRLATLDSRDCRYGPLKARSVALKWLLVVCFGYLGYKNARFGRIESHEAVTAYGREALLRAKEAAEHLGFCVLHMSVDGLWVRKPSASTVADFQPLLNEILERTRLPVALEGIYKWVAFLPSRQDGRVPVANRYFGVFQDGSLKLRGIEARRRDTPPFIVQTQLEMLHKLAKTSLDPNNVPLSDILSLLERRLAALRAGRVPLEGLLVAQKLSRELDEFSTPSPVARATTQLEAAGKTVSPGQRVRFLYTRGESGVYAWDLPETPDLASIDVARYSELFVRAASTVLGPFGVDEDLLRQWLFSNAAYSAPPGALPPYGKGTLPLLSRLKAGNLTNVY